MPLKFHWCVFLIFVASTCIAVPTRYGGEFTVRNSAAVAGSKPGLDVRVFDGLEELRKEMVRHCPVWGCRIETIKDTDKIIRHRITYPDGFYFDLSVDIGVIEVTAPPGNLEEWKQREQRLQEHFFQSAARLGWTPDVDKGGGHVHIDAKAFEKNALLLRNWIVDFYNHPELAFGVLRHEKKLSGSHWVHLSKETQLALQSVIQRFDRDGAAGKPWTSQQLGLTIYEEVQRPARDRGEVEEARNFAMNFERFVTHPEGERTVEVRSVRPQANMQSFFQVLTLFEKRLDYLKSKNKPMGLRPAAVNWDASHPEIARARFALYLSEMNLSLDSEFENMLAPELALSSCKKALEIVNSK